MEYESCRSGRSYSGSLPIRQRLYQLKCVLPEKSIECDINYSAAVDYDRDWKFAPTVAANLASGEMNEFAGHGAILAFGSTFRQSTRIQSSEKRCGLVPSATILQA